MVREFFVKSTKGYSKRQSVIMDGRDIGTVVLKDATVKIFLTADVEKRAMRRYLEGKDNLSFEQILEDVKKRDYQDENREIAPLKAAEDAIIVDTSQ